MAETSRPLLTVPERLEDEPPVWPTGNHYVALPALRLSDGGLMSANVIMMSTASMIEFTGTGGLPLIQPRVSVNGRAISLESIVRWSRTAHWIPRFTASVDGIDLAGEVICPPGQRGFVYRLRARCTGGGERHVSLGFSCSVGTPLETIYTSRPLAGVLRVAGDGWSGGPVVEFVGGSSVAAMALASPAGEFAWWEPGSCSDEEEGLVDNNPIPDITGKPNLSLSAPADPASGGAGVRISLARTEEPAPGEEMELALCVALHRDRDGARTTAVHLLRSTPDHWWREQVDWLESHSLPPELWGNQEHGAASWNLLPPQVRRRVVELYHLNAFFNYFFALARTVDSEELVLMTSRSPRYYVSAAFWARDSVLWSLPSVLDVERALGREFLLTLFGRYLRNAGEHSLYIDGSVLYPGFELDQLAAYVVALERYISATADWAILEMSEVAAGLRRVLDLLESHRDPATGLYDTYLLPSDDPAMYPFVTYDNVLAWRAFRTAALLAARTGDGARANRLRHRADNLREAVERYCIREEVGRPMFVWSCDGEGNYRIYDEPPGSLQLLAYYGFVGADESSYLNTVAWIYSKENPYAYCGVPFPGVGCPHSPSPFVMGVFNELMCGRVGPTLPVLAGAPLDQGLACESFDPVTGRVATGAAFATCAGFFAHSLAVAFGAVRDCLFADSPAGEEL